MLALNVFTDFIQDGIYGFLLGLDSIVYWLVSELFSLFEELASLDMLKSGAYEEISSKLLVILGVFMLFYLAYALLKALVNPKDFQKDTSKIVTNLIISLVLLNVVPAIFDYAFQLQNIIITDNIIGKVISSNAQANVANIGREVAMTTLEGCLKVDDSIKDININGTVYDWPSLRTAIVNNEDVENESDVSFFAIRALSHYVTDGEVEYIFIVSTACGIFLAYIILSFCLDLGVRIFKLAFYQLISPIPIIMRIIPEKKSVFDNWVKASLSTYFEVFVRLFIMYLVTFLANLVITGTEIKDISIFAKIVLILGLFAFAKQAPKLVSDALGIKGNLKLGIKSKLNDSGFIGKSMTNFGSRATGFITGGLGGMAASMLNKGGAGGFLAGAANGWKGKGTQFSKQHQDVYKMMGGKGKAGMFGGQALGDRYLDTMKDKSKSTMKEAREQSISNFENSDKFKKYVEENIKLQQKGFDEVVAKALAEYNDVLSKASVKNLSDAMAAYEQYSQYYKDDILKSNNVIKNVNEKLKELSVKGITPTAEMKNKIIKSEAIKELKRRFASDPDSLDKDSKEYLQRVDQFNVQTAKAAQNLEAAQNLKPDLEAAQKSARDHFVSKNADEKGRSARIYKANYNKAEEDRKESALKEYLKSPEGQRAVATQQEALKKIDEENKKKANPLADKPIDKK